MERILRGIQVFLVVAMLFALTACANLLDGNMFENFDSPPSAADILGGYTDEDGTVPPESADGFVDDLGDAAESGRFFDDLTDEDRGELETALESIYDNEEVDTETRQDAAVLAGEIAIRGTGAGETVNNVVDVLIDSDEGADAFNDTGALLDAIVPAEAQGDADAVRDILESMVTAANAYEALGSTMTDEDGDGTPDGPDGANMGEVSQNAAVSIILAETADTDGDGEVSEAELDALTAATVNDDFSGYTGDPLGDSLGDDDNPTPLRNILESGGLLGVFEE